MELPLDPVIQAVAQRYGRILASVGTELGARPLVLPNNKYFPDRFTEDTVSAKRMIARMQSG